MAGYYDPNKDYSKAISEAKAAGKDTSQLEAERQNKIDDKYGGKEPTMYGSNKTYSQASRDNDRDTISNAISISNGRGSSKSASNGNRNTGGNVSTPSNGRGSSSSTSGNRVTNLPGNAQPAQAAQTPLAPAQLPALNQYGYRDMDYTTAIQNATSAAERAQLLQERANKIQYQYGGVEPNMIGSNQKFSNTLAGSSSGQASGLGAVGSTNELMKGPGYVTGGYTIGVNGSPILNDNPYWKGTTGTKADMSRRPDLAGGYATSNGYTVFYDEDGYAYKASKGVADFLPIKDLNASNGTYNKTGAWTDNEILTPEQVALIQSYRDAANAGTMTWAEANAAANAIRSGYGYTIDKQGNVYNSGVISAVNDRRQKYGLPVTQEDGATAYYRYLMGTDTSPLAQATGQVKTYQQFATENGYDANVPTTARNFDYSAPTGVNGTVPIVQTTPMPGNSVIGGSGAVGGGISGSGNLDLSPGTADVYTPGNMGDYLNQWYQNAQQQQQNTVDFGTNQAILELLRNKQDAEAQYQEQRNQIAIDEAKAKDNQALYAESRGDKGGIGAAQYDAIMNTAAQNRLAVNSAQTKLATDTSRQIADLRAQGEYEKADALLTLSQQYLSQLMSLEQWAAEYNLSVAQFNASLKQWQAEYDLKVADLLGSYNGQKTMSAKQFEFTQQQYQDSLKADQEKRLASAGEILLAAGIMPSASQLAAMGMTTTEAQSYITAQKVAAAATKGKSGKGNGGGGGGGTVTSMDYDGLFKAARDSGNPQSFIANNYKKYGFKSPTGLYNEYKTAVETPVKSNMEMQADHYRAFTQSIAAQLSAGQINAALGNINSRWSELSAAQKQGIQDLLLKYGIQYNPGD